MKRANFFHLYVEIFTKLEKGVIECELEEKVVIGCKIGVKKGVLWQAVDTQQHMGVPPSPRGLKIEPSYIFWKSWTFCHGVL